MIKIANGIIRRQGNCFVKLRHGSTAYVTSKAIFIGDDDKYGYVKYCVND